MNAESNTTPPAVKETIGASSFGTKRSQVQILSPRLDGASTCAKSIDNSRNPVPCAVPPCWQLSHRFSPAAARFADRHYSRQKIGSPQFVAPGSPLVLFIGNPIAAMWVTLKQQFIDHAWKNCLANVFFRNESGELSSTMILSAVAVSRWKFGDPPADGMITFVDASKVKHKRDPGRCYRKAGFTHIACLTKTRKLVFQLAPGQWPEAAPPFNPQRSLFGIGGAA